MSINKQHITLNTVSRYILTIVLCLFITITSCDSDNSELVDNSSPDFIIESDNENNSEEQNVKYLALGDSYTIGQSVCESCNYPSQLSKFLKNDLNLEVDLTIIAQTGWTTTNLLDAIESQKPSEDNDLVTLLIGVNNQFQRRDFKIYETEFLTLLNKAVVLANYDLKNVVVISIPDYAYTPFGEGLNNADDVSREIDKYNEFAERTATSRGIKFVDITDIARLGLSDPDLVAVDGLHPSEKAYTLFAGRLLPICKDILKN